MPDPDPERCECGHDRNCHNPSNTRCNACLLNSIGPNPGAFHAFRPAPDRGAGGCANGAGNAGYLPLRPRDGW